MNDTDPQIAELVRQRLMERSGTERIIMASGMFEAAKAMVLASFPEGLTELEIKERLCDASTVMKSTPMVLWNT